MIKRKESAIPAQDNVRHLFKPESSKGEEQMLVFISGDWKSLLGVEWPGAVVRWEQPSPVAHLSAARLFDVRHRAYNRFSRLRLPRSKNYEYFCAQNKDLELRLLHKYIRLWSYEKVYFLELAEVKTGKLQQLKILNGSQKYQIWFPRLSVNFHKSTRLVPTPSQTPLRIS